MSPRQLLKSVFDNIETGTLINLKLVYSILNGPLYKDDAALQLYMKDLRFHGALKNRVHKENKRRADTDALNMKIEL